MKYNWLWFNEPDQWSQDADGIHLFVTRKTDYWRETHYGFTVDDGLFAYLERGGEFEVKVKLLGHYQYRFDQMGLMFRVDEQNWIKTGVEFVDDRINISAVVTREKSDWSMMAVDERWPFVWIKAIRRLDAVEIFYSRDDETYQMIRLAHFPGNRAVKVGLYAASPDGEGFDATFTNFTITHLPDLRREQWLAKNQ
ncbi:MAG: DUF1349 domain-containing protein [Saprospiraceae bacterium]|nr:DUF1349 domain-containing protein [Saprospiraceae bacterium]